MATRVEITYNKCKRELERLKSLWDTYQSRIVKNGEALLKLKEIDKAPILDNAGEVARGVIDKYRQANTEPDEPFSWEAAQKAIDNPRKLAKGEEVAYKLLNAFDSLEETLVKIKKAEAAYEKAELAFRNQTRVSPKDVEQERLVREGFDRMSELDMTIFKDWNGSFKTRMKEACQMQLENGDIEDWQYERETSDRNLEQKMNEQLARLVKLTYPKIGLIKKVEFNQYDLDNFEGYVEGETGERYYVRSILVWGIYVRVHYRFNATKA